MTKFIDPWTSKAASKPIAETASESPIMSNPLKELVHGKLKPDQAPLSPMSKKPMIETAVGKQGEAKTRIWVSIEDRVALPRLSSQK